MIEERIYVAQWLQLPLEARVAIAEKFRLKKSSGVVSHTAFGKTVVECDGHTIEDLAELTKEKMEEFIGVKSDAATITQLLTACAEVALGNETKDNEVRPAKAKKTK